MSIPEQEIDRLFQLPLNEFTPARNALAKGAGPAAAAIKRLHRPHAAAWAVNQLYWQRRNAFDRLISAAERLRAAHTGLMSGKRVDVAAAEQAHRDALKAAMEDIRHLIAEGGEKPTPATMTAVNETLQALPHPTETAGRLVRPLKPLGFEALSGLLGGALGGAKRPAEVVPFDRSRRAAATDVYEPSARPAPSSREDAAQRRREEQARAREEAAREREAERLKKELAAAVTTEREMQKALTRARQAVEKAERDRERAQEQLASASEQLARARKDMDSADEKFIDAAGDRARLEKLLRDFN
jgi:hypothetical protein